jgi:hypothetical protein
MSACQSRPWEANRNAQHQIRTRRGSRRVGGFAVAAPHRRIPGQWHNYCGALRRTRELHDRQQPCPAIKSNYENAYDGLLGGIEGKPVLVNGPSGPRSNKKHQIEEEARVAKPKGG